MNRRLNISGTSALRLLAALLVAAGAAGVMRPDAVGDYAAGRSGEALKRTLRQHCSPTAPVDREQLTADEWWRLLAAQQAAADGSGRVADAVTAQAYPAAEARTTLVDIAVVHGDWFGYPPAYKAAAEADLYNNVLTCIEAMQARLTIRAWASTAEATDVALGNGWSSGKVLFEGWGEVPVIEPANDAKGALARRIMYVATVYPCTKWYGDAAMFFTDAEYPGLTGYAISTYLAWHREHPVGDAERQANDAVEARQGNRNPFVDHPDLIEYVWGEHAGEVYPGGGGGGGGEPTARTPLRGAYSIATDGHLDLYSPYVGDGAAAWTVDGAAAAAERIPLAELGTGRHELKYSSPAGAGKLIIEVNP